MIIRTLKAFSITFLILGLVSLLGILYLAEYNSNHCAPNCNAAGIVEGIIIMIFSIPLILAGSITGSIAYFLNKKNQQTQVNDNKIDSSRVLFILAILIFIFSIVLVPDIYFGIYNFSRDYIEIIFGL